MHLSILPAASILVAQMSIAHAKDGSLILKGAKSSPSHLRASASVTHPKDDSAPPKEAKSSKQRHDAKSKSNHHHHHISPGRKNKENEHNIYGSIVNTGSTTSARALDIYQGSCDPGTNINLWHQTGNDNQKWIYHTKTGAIESVACPGMVLDIEGGVGSYCEPETNIILWHDTGVAWQQWIYSPDGKLISKYCENMVIDIFNGNDADGANIQLFYDNTSGNGWNQVWGFQSNADINEKRQVVEHQLDEEWTQ